MTGDDERAPDDGRTDGPARPSSDIEFLHPFFLGPSAENADLLEALVTEFLRDHVYWRRNFHPEDGQRVRAGARHDAHYLDSRARMRAELYELGAELKRAVPFFHPRYVGHMNADLLLPGVVAKIVTTLYNPNNVSEEAAPVTLEKELQVGEQLARMLGFPADDGAEPCAWGHLTSGGTVANYEALWNLRSLKFYGLALRAGAADAGLDLGPVAPGGRRLEECSEWELLNLPVDEVVALRNRVAERLRDAGRVEVHEFSRAVRSRRIETLGSGGFLQEHPDVPPPRVLVATSAHYSWEKAMKVLGLGTAHLVRVGVDDHMRMDAGDLDACLDEASSERAPVLAVVGTLGTTEFGTVDPIHEIVAARGRWRERGLDFGIHVDGAWGGYLATVFRRADGGFESRDVIARDFRHFPSDVLYRAFRAIPEADSVTVDPHKLGYIPYAAGAFVARNREVVDFIGQEAAYVFDVDAERKREPRDRLRDLGRYILEGSKPGAAAAAVHVAHRVLPLHRDGMGRVLRQTIRACEYFYDTALEMAERLEGVVRLRVPFEPDSNLITIAVNPAGNRDLAAMNRFGRRLFSRMQVDAGQPVQVREFIGSYTSLLEESLPAGQARRLLDALGLDPSTFREVPEDDAREADHIFLLRHTLMNPWLLSGPGERNYIDLYWDFVRRAIREETGARPDGGNRP